MSAGAPTYAEPMAGARENSEKERRRRAASEVAPGDGESRLRSLEAWPDGDRLLREEQAARLVAERSAAEIAELHARAERALHRNTRLQEVAEAFSEARLPIDVAAVVLTQGCVAVDAPRGVVGLLAEEGAALEPRWTIGYPDEGKAAWPRLLASDILPLTDVIRSGTAVFLDTVPTLPADDPELGRRSGGALVAVPLTVGGRVIGALGFDYDDPRAFDCEERAFILTVTRLCAQALDRARLYEAEAQARAEADAASRAKDDFLAVLSHELRTPLMAILGWANLLRSGQREPAAVARGLATIERNATTQAQLIDDLLDVSRIVAGKVRLELRAVDPAAIVRAAIDAVRPAAEAKHLLVEAVVDDAIGPLRADGARLQQVAWNLLSNAVKFTPAGGRIEVRLHRVPSGIRLRVSDSGEGIAPAFLPHVFERFRQADGGEARSRGGLGLGLAILKHLVELHEGTVTAWSAGLGQGATFTVTFPLPPGNGDDPGDLRHTDRPIPGALRLAGLRVVVVDDEPDVRELIACLLYTSDAADE